MIRMCSGQKKMGIVVVLAYKILEINDKFGFLLPGKCIVDLGCAPGGWLQVAVPKINSNHARSSKKTGRIIGIDLQEIEPIPGVESYVLDFLSNDD